MSQHTKEPWLAMPARTSGWCLVNKTGDVIVGSSDEFGHYGAISKEEDARRILACVKACFDISTDALMAMPQSFGKLLSQDFQSVIAQRDALLAATEEIIRISDRKHDAWDRAKAVIAEIKGGDNE